MFRKIKPILAMTLVCALTLAMSPNTFAADLVDSVGSSSSDLTVGADTTQNKQTEYQEETIKTTTYNQTSSVTVYATKAGWARVSIPKILILGEDANNDSLFSGSFKISVTGDISGSQRITITPDASATLVETSGKSTTSVATISLKDDATNFVVTANDLLDNKTASITGTISASNLKAGTYSASFGIGVVITRE